MEAAVAGAVALEHGGSGRVVSLRDVSDRLRREAEAASHRGRLESLGEKIDDVLVTRGPAVTGIWTREREEGREGQARDRAVSTRGPPYNQQQKQRIYKRSDTSEA